MIGEIPFRCIDELWRTVSDGKQANDLFIMEGFTREVDRQINDSALYCYATGMSLFSYKQKPIPWFKA